jgi:hypothetical protein
MDSLCGKEEGVGPEDGAVMLQQDAAGHLRSALEQMDLLLQTQQTDVALGHLVAMLKHLRVVGCSIR